MGVAYSGGRDSTALLHATVAAAATQGVRVAALHVHHGLSPHADAWLAHARRTCAAWARAGRPVQLHWARLAERPAPGDSVEAWARDQRYRALADLARQAGAGLVLLAHHRRDQAETVLLQALRGAGVAGLAAMPRLQARAGLAWARPWLDLDPREIAAYVSRHRLRYVDDQSNRDDRFDRSRLRHVVWPVLEAAFPQAEPMLARTAQWMAQADSALASVAGRDLAGAEGSAGDLDLAALGGLPAARARQAVRAWLRERLGRPAPASLVERLLAETVDLRHGTWPAPGGELRLARGRLVYRPAEAGGRARSERHLGPGSGPGRAVAAPTQPVGPWLPPWPLAGPRRLRWPGSGGAWLLRPVEVGGLAWDRLLHAEARPRQGGESFQAGPGRPPRSLKKQYQAAGIDRWHREGPLVWLGDTLLAVPGLGIDARVRALSGEPQVSLTWIPDAADDGA